MANDFSNNKWMIGDISPLSSLSTFGLIYQDQLLFLGATLRVIYLYHSARCLSVAGPTSAQFEIFFSSDYL